MRKLPLITVTAALALLSASNAFAACDARTLTGHEPGNTRAEALRDAITDWADGVEDDHGPGWRSWDRASDNQAQCAWNDGDRNWECSVQARPCD